MSRTIIWDGLSWSSICKKADNAQNEMDKSLEEYIERYGKTKRAIETRNRVNAVRWTLSLLERVEGIVLDINDYIEDTPESGIDSKQLIEKIKYLVEFIKS